MANSYIRGSFIIPCDRPTAERVQNAFKHVCNCYHTNGDTNPTEHAAKVFSDVSDGTVDISDLGQDDHFIYLCLANYPERQPGEDYIDDAEWYLDIRIDDCGLCICEDETFDPEQAAILTQAILCAYDLEQPIKFEASYICDRPRPGAFGGLAVLVTKDEITSKSTSSLFADEMGAIKRGIHYHNGTFLIASNGANYRIDVVFERPCDTDPMEELTKIMLNFKEGGTYIGDFIRYTDGSYAHQPQITAVTATEFITLKKFLQQK